MVDSTAAQANRRGKLIRKFFLRVVLPPLVPFLVLGYLGYSQLSGLVAAATLNQLSESAATTAAKLERELSIRQTILERTGEDVFTIKAEFDQKRAALTKQKEGCLAAIRKNISSGSQHTDSSSSTDNVINEPNGNCDPFLSEFARVAGNPSVDIRQAYTNGVNTGYDKQIEEFDNDEKAKIDDRLTAYQVFFPETSDILIVGTDSTVIAGLDTDATHLDAKSQMGLSALTGPVISPLTGSGNKQLILSGLPVESTEKLGAILAAYDADGDDFIKPAIESAPKLHSGDKIYVLDSAGSAIYPLGEDTLSLKPVAGSTVSAAGGRKNFRGYTFNLGGETYAARTSEISDVGWTVIVGSPESFLVGTLRNAQNLALAAILVSLALSLLVGFLFVSGAVRSIKKLAQGASVFARHKLDHRIDLHTDDELESLAETLNDMASQIQVAEKALEEKNKEFISIATHELKAPMTSIIGNLSMVVDEGMGKVDKQAHTMIDQAYQSSVRLRDLVNDLLDIARMEAGRAQFDMVSVDIAEEIKTTISMQTVVADQQKIKLIYSPEVKVPNVLVDQNKLRIILTNFISNAIKYNRSGGSVTVSHKLEDGKLVTMIADTGLGIPKDQQAKMFQKFFRVESKDRAGIPGTGLGLYVTKQFIEHMGGELQLKSEAGKGSTFSFSLPLV